eukprot:527042_1
MTTFTFTIILSFITGSLNASNTTTWKQLLTTQDFDVVCYTTDETNNHGQHMYQPLKLLHNTIFNSNPNNSLSIPPNTRFYFQYQLHELYRVNNIKIQFDYSPNIFIPESDKTFIAFIYEGKIIPFSNTKQNAKMNQQTDNIYTSYTASHSESNEYFTKDIIISIDFSSKANDIFDKWYILYSNINVYTETIITKEKELQQELNTKNEKNMEIPGENALKLTIQNEVGQSLEMYFDDDTNDGKFIFELKNKEKRLVSDIDVNYRFYFVPPDNKKNILFDFIMETAYNEGRIIIRRKSLTFVHPKTKHRIKIRERSYDKLEKQKKVKKEKNIGDNSSDSNSKKKGKTGVNPFKLTIKNEADEPLAVYYDDSTDDGKLMLNLKADGKRILNTDSGHRFYFVPPGDEKNMLFDFVMEKQYDGGIIIIRRKSLMFLDPKTKNRITIRERSYDKLSKKNEENIRVNEIIDDEIVQEKDVYADEINQCDASNGSCIGNEYISENENEKEVVSREDELNKMRISELRNILVEYINEFYDLLTKDELKKTFNYKLFVEKGEYVNAVIKFESYFGGGIQDKIDEMNEKHLKEKQKEKIKEEKTIANYGEYVAGNFNIFLFCLIISVIRTGCQMYELIASVDDISDELWYKLFDCIIELSVITYIHIYASDRIFSLYVIHLLPLFYLQYKLFGYLKSEEL